MKAKRGLEAELSLKLLSQPGKACKRPFPPGTEQSHSWELSRRPTGPDHSAVRATLPWDLGSAVARNLWLALIRQELGPLPSRA